VSQKKKPHQQKPITPTTPESETLSSPWPEHLRRGLLGMITALVVARPLVLGEDPGMLAVQTDSSHLVLTLFWFMTAVGWGIWRWWSGNVSWQGGIVEAALLAACILVAASSIPASYRHPAVLIAWEWFALFTGLFLVRQLATTASDQRHLLAAFLASVVSLSAHAIFQARVELPALRENMERFPPPPRQLKVQPRQALAFWGAGTAGPLQVAGLVYPIGVEQAENSGGMKDIRKEVERRVEQGHAYATFVNPSTLAGYLILFLPALVAAAFLLIRQQPQSLSGWIGIGCVGLVVLALLCSRSGQGGLLGLAIAGWIAIFLLRWKGRPGGLLGLVAVGVAVFAVWQFPSDWADSWHTAWGMIRAFPWLGVGGGNYGRHSSQFLRPGEEPAAEPGNFVLELWAGSGLFALLAVLAALGAFFWLVIRPASIETAEPAAEKPEQEKTRWEFYVWGMVGLLLGYILRQVGGSADDGSTNEFDARIEAIVTAFRAVIWFGAYALFENVRWPGRWLSGALAAGVFALLSQLSVASGINYPALASPLWLVVGLALAGLGLKPHESDPQSWLVKAAPLVVALGFLIAFVVYPFDPVTSAMNLARASARAERLRKEDRDSQKPEIRDPRKFFTDRVVRPLDDAVKLDPADSRWQLQRGARYAELWDASWNDRESGPKYGTEALRAIHEAQRVDPLGPASHRAMYELHVLFAAREKLPQKKKTQFSLAADALQRVAKNDPTNPWHHYRLAQTYFDAGLPEKARKAAQDAVDANRAITVRSPRQLGDWQLYQVEEWARKPPTTSEK
jgi:O-antigen ligase